MKHFVLKFILGFVVIPLGLAGTLYYLNSVGFFNISELEVVLVSVPEGQQNYLEPLVAGLRESVKPYQGISLWNIDLKKVIKTVRANPWIETVSIKRNWPSTLQIQVLPYEVKLLYLGKNGQLVPVIRDGTMMEAVQAPQAPDVALLDGDNFLKKNELRKKAVQVIEEIPAQGSFSKKSISEIRYDGKDGFWMTMIKTGVQVKLGEDQVSLKAARVSKVVDYLESRQLDVRVIDANLSKKVLVRLRKDP